MYVYIYIHSHIHTYLYICIHGRTGETRRWDLKQDSTRNIPLVFTRRHTHVLQYPHTHTYIHTHTHTHTRTRTRTHTCQQCTFSHMYTPTHVSVPDNPSHTRVYTHTHTKLRPTPINHPPTHLPTRTPPTHPHTSTHTHLRTYWTWRWQVGRKTTHARQSSLPLCCQSQCHTAMNLGARLHSGESRDVTTWQLPTRDLRTTLSRSYRGSFWGGWAGGLASVVVV